MGTRVFVRLYDGQRQVETPAEVLTLPPPPLTWAGVIAAMAGAVKKEEDDDDNNAPTDQDLSKARLFLLPTEAQGIAAELNARSLRFGIREDDQFVICLNGEDYQQPASKNEIVEESTATVTITAETTTNAPSSVSSEIQYGAYTTTERGAPSGNIGGTLGGSIGGAPPGGLLGGLSGTKAGNKRYRSISGKMAAIKSLGDKGLISADDRGHLKDLLLNNNSPQLQEALDNYNNTGDFQAVKDLLMKELKNPAAKRNTGEWLSESLMNDIALSGTIGSSNAQKAETSFGSNYATMSSTPNPFLYQSTNQSSYSTSALTSNSSSPSNPTQLVGSYQSSSHVLPDPFNQPHLSPTGMYPPAHQINLPLRDRNSFMKRGYDASSGMMGLSSQMDPTLGPSQYAGYSGGLGYGNDVTQDYARMGSMNAYGMLNGSTAAAGGYNSMLPHQPFGINRYGMYDASTSSFLSSYDYYSAGGYGGYGKAAFRGGGKWTTTPPMPSYPPPCSKEEKKEKIARWLKKREHRNWSNKPSYPVRHSIAKNRKRGEDGRFITKAKLAAMAAEEEALAAQQEMVNTSSNNNINAAGIGIGLMESVNMMPHHHHPSIAAPTRVL